MRPQLLLQSEQYLALFHESGERIPDEPIGGELVEVSGRLAIRELIDIGGLILPGSSAPVSSRLDLP